MDQLRTGASRLANDGYGLGRGRGAVEKHRRRMNRGKPNE